MAFPLVPSTLLLITSGLVVLDYFDNFEYAPSNVTVPRDPSYSPPFRGGQCVGNAYTVIVGATYTSGSDSKKYYFPRNFASGSQSLEGIKPFANAQPPFIGAIPNPTFYTSGSTRVANFGSVGSINMALSIFEYPNSYGLVQGSEFVAYVGNRTNPSDSCGDIPDPTPPSIPDDGLADSTPPDVIGQGDELVEGLVPVSIAPILAAALAALRAAQDIASAAQAIANAIDAIADLIDRLDPKNRDKGKSIISYAFGNISKDGFLRLYPSSDIVGLTCLYLDINITQIPVGYGKFFGKLSPHRYRYQELGYIAFVSPSFGIIRTESIQYVRSSFEVPSNSIGFFYHLGLNGAVKANAVGIYEKELEVETQ